MINISEQRLQTTCLLFIVAVLSSFAAYWLRPVLVPFVVAVFIVSGVSPILEALQRSVASTRLMAAAIAFLVGCLLIAILMGALWASVVDLAKNAGAYQTRVEELISEAQDYIPWDTSETSSHTRQKKPSEESSPQESRDSEDASPEAVPPEESASGENSTSKTEEQETSSSEEQEDRENREPTENNPADQQETTNQPRNKSTVDTIEAGFTNIKTKNPTERFEEFVTRTLKSGVFQLSQVFLEMISTSLIVLIYVFFLLLGAPASQTTSPVWRDLDRQIRTYLSLKTVISLFTGAAFGFALWLFGIPMAVAFGMLAFLLNFIPNIGPIIASLLPLPLIILAPDGTLLWMVMVISVTFGIQFLSGNVIEPKIMGQQSDLHPIVILLALMFWGMLWGIVGMFLATPITAAIRLALLQFELTRPVAELMAGRLPGKDESMASTT